MAATLWPTAGGARSKVVVVEDPVVVGGAATGVVDGTTEDFLAAAISEEWLHPANAAVRQTADNAAVTRRIRVQSKVTL